MGNGVGVVGVGVAKGPPLFQGQRVLTNYREKGKYYDGTIGSVNYNGTVDIRYDDGDFERGVRTCNVRLHNQKQAMALKTASKEVIHQEEGQMVQRTCQEKPSFQNESNSITTAKKTPSGVALLKQYLNENSTQLPPESDL